jgi:hypothetical protein
MCYESTLSIYIRLSQISGVLGKYFYSVASSSLVFSGMFLMTFGVLTLSSAQRDPEPAQDQNPEGLCCTIIPEPVLLLLLPEQLNIAEAPENLIQDTTQINPLENTPPEPLEADYDDTLNRFATGNLLRFIEGSFGALIMVGAGLGAIIAGAFGAYKAAISMLVVAVGAFILRALVSLFFGTDYEAYAAGGIEFVGGGL